MAEVTVRKPFAFLVKPGMQIFLMICTATLLFSLSYYRMKECKPTDRSPGLQSFEQQKAYTIKTHVHTGLLIRNFLEFDVLKNTFVADAYVWFEFDPHQVPLKTIEDFYFGKGIIEQKSHPYLTSEKNKMRAGYNVQIKFQTNLDYHYFPIDSHRLYLTLNNASLPKHEVVFDAPIDSFQISPTIYASGWTYQNKSTVSGLQVNTIDQKTQKKIVSPRAIFSLDFSNESFKRFILIILPLFIVFFLSLFTLSIDPIRQYETVVGIPAAMMTALVSYFFVIESVSPKVAYFTLADVFFNVFLVLNFMIFVFDAICVKLFLAHRGILVLLFHLLLIASWVFLLYWW